MGLFEPYTVQDDVNPAGEPAAGGLAHILSQRLFSQPTTLLNEIKELDLHGQSRIPRLHVSNP